MKLLSTIEWSITVYNNNYVSKDTTCKQLIKMKLYCLKCWKDTENINPRVSNTSNGRKMISSKCEICGSKNSRFIKDQEAKGLLSNLGTKTPLSKVPILGDIFFLMRTLICISK